MNDYAKFVEWLKQNANQVALCHNLWPLEKMAQESGISERHIWNYLEILEEQDDTFSYCLFTEGLGSSGYMCEFFWDDNTQN